MRFKSRVSDVSATGTERSGACARPLFRSGAVRDCLSVDGRKQSGAKCRELKARSHGASALALSILRKTVCGVWRGSEAEAQTRKHEHRSRSKLTRQSPQSVGRHRCGSRASAAAISRGWCRRNETKHSRANRAPSLLWRSEVGEVAEPCSRSTRGRAQAPRREAPSSSFRRQRAQMIVANPPGLLEMVTQERDDGWHRARCSERAAGSVPLN